MGFAENTVKFRGKEVQAQERNKRDILVGVSNQCSVFVFRLQVNVLLQKMV
jgi:hypothetical protein